MAASFFTQKDPNDILDYSIDWSQWLASGDFISTSTWTSTSSAIVLATNTNGTATTTIWASGGTAGEVYDIANIIVTNDGRQEERRIELTVVYR